MFFNNDYLFRLFITFNSLYIQVPSKAVFHKKLNITILLQIFYTLSLLLYQRLKLHSKTTLFLWDF